VQFGSERPIALPDPIQRIKRVRRHLITRAMTYAELFEKGGRHPKDLEAARILHYIAALLVSVFPEVDEW
jgi:hypothetical protein